ncbi:hypothetical protein PybrP1_009306 [[Pythium] brassicae (nom. inval.)]|nr:hypothetical protein PybrP1_009306 [[Pythium] brassicae (nom. inval.)]
MADVKQPVAPAASPPVNSELLVSMMSCVDTSLFSAQQLQNWEQMKHKIRAAAAANAPLAAEVVHEFIAKNAPPPKPAGGSDSKQPPAAAERQLLHREASIQDVLACLLEQQAPTSRMLSAAGSGSGSSFLLSSEAKSRAEDNKPTLKSLLSSNDFSMTEKKESLRHLLSFIDNSFASTAEPLTQVYKDAEDGSLQRLSSLHLMRSFMTPGSGGAAQPMGRTTSFEIIQAMLNATSNQAIQKPMSSQDSFRFQHLARTLESIESDVGYDNEDYGGDDVVQVDNLDNLLDYHGPSAGAQPPPQQPVGVNLGFVDTQALVNPSRSLYGEYGSTATGYQQQSQQQQYGRVDANSLQSMYSSQALGGYDANGNGAATGLPPPYHHLPGAQQQRIQVPGGAAASQVKQQKQDAAGGAPICSALGCNHPARVKGMCKLHGGGRRCKVEGCMKSAQTGHLCIAHGGGKPCNVEGCPKTAQSRGLCKQHGGGVRCKFEGCTKSCQSGGFCRGHGGGKRCEFPNCTKWAQKNGHCAKHAQELSQKAAAASHP